MRAIGAFVWMKSTAAGKSLLKKDVRWFGSIISKIGGERAAQVVKRPTSDTTCLVERLLAAGKAVEELLLAVSAGE